MSNRRTFSKDEKRMIYEAYDGRCAICGEPVSKNKMTISHRVPLSRGGTNGLRNLMLACWDCNQMQHNLGMDEFLIAIDKIHRFNGNKS